MRCAIRLRVSIALSILLGACGNNPPAPEPAEVQALQALQALSPEEQLVRASMTLRQVRPSADELAQVRNNPAALESIVDAYLESPEFLVVMRDMHAELFLLRTDTFNQLPALGLLQGYNLQDIYVSQTEEPLKLIEHVIANDMPYTEIVTADWMLTDRVTAIMYGLPYDDDAPEEWQMSYWPDDRPKAGILSSAEIWRRWESDGSNFHRGRANMIASRLLCEDFDTRDILVEGGIDISDEFAVAEAAKNVPACVGCHQSLDPLAAYFWGYMQLIHRNAVRDAILQGCPPHDFSDGIQPPYGANHVPENFCYPINQYSAYMEDTWEFWDLRPPSYFGVDARDATEVGQLIADDPRFHQCTARNVYGFFSQTHADDVPWSTAVELQQTFVDSGFNMKALVKAVVMHPTQGAWATADDQHVPIVSLKTIRPQEFATLVEDLTGYRWWADADPANCATRSINGTECWGNVDLSTSDLYGFRSMQGGIDALNITRPTHTVTPTKLLSMGLLAVDASRHVIESDFQIADPGSRKLFTQIEESDSDEAKVRAQLVALFDRIFGQQVDANSDDVTLYWELFSQTLDQRGAPRDAWTVTLTAMFQDPAVLFY